MATKIARATGVGAVARRLPCVDVPFDVLVDSAFKPCTLLFDFREKVLPPQSQLDKNGVR